MKASLAFAATLAAGVAVCMTVGVAPKQAAPTHAPPAQARPGDKDERVPANSADRLLFWVSAEEVAGLTDAQLDLWKGRGVGGFVCMTRHLPGMGGTCHFTGDPDAGLAAKGYELQRALRDSGVVDRAKRRGMKMYLGCWLVNYHNAATPLKDWFDDAGWAGEAVPRVRDVSAAAKLLGFDGIAFDQELYPQVDNKATATWAWDYPGNTHAEADVRAAARRRGAELMKAILDGFPAVQIVVYHYQFPETWEAVVQKQVNQIENAGGPVLFLDFWDGMTGVEGYGAVRFINALFYKTPHLGTWDAALQYEQNSFYGVLSRRLSNWPYASSRVFQSPFAWIDAGPDPGGFDAARPPEYVAAQLAAFGKWGTGGEVANYAHRGLGGFDYEPYARAMRAAATPSVVDREPPGLRVSSPPAGDGPFETGDAAVGVAGHAVDNLAIRAVRWTNDRGGGGAARMTWRVKSGTPATGYDWRTDWSIERVPLQPGANRILIAAEDIKGLTSAQTLVVNRR